MSPACMRLGAGVSFKKGEAIAFQLNPLNVRLILVDNTFMSTLSEGETFFGYLQLIRLAGKQALLFRCKASLKWQKMLSY